MDKQRLRSEVEEQYKWDLERIYKRDEDWYKDYDVVANLSQGCIAYDKTMFQDKDKLSKYLKLNEEISLYLNKLSSYASLRSSEDATNTKYQEMDKLVTDLVININNVESFFDEGLYTCDIDKLYGLLRNDEYLATYKTYFDRKLRFKEHYLSEEQEKLVNSFSKSLNAPSEIYSMLSDAEMKFGIIKNEDNKDVELTESNYSIFITSKDRRVRKDAFNALYKTWGSFKNTVTLTYINDVDASIALNKTYNYLSVLKASLYSNDIPVSVYTNLISSVRNNLKPLFDYYNYKKKLLNLDEFHIYDVYVKVVDASTSSYTFLDAKNMVLKALSPLGEEYISKAETIFNNRLIDVYNNVGKTSGAFSSGTYDTDPYILLNFEGKYNDVSTIAHELGHSMHTTYSKENNLRQYADYSIFVAEVASTVNELLLSDYMLKNTTNNNEKKYILNELLDTYKGTLYRQTMFAEFEKIIYETREAKAPLTHESICKIYYDLNKDYFGSKVVVDDLIKYEWERVPHFYNAFYVYKYATSICASTYIANKIISGDAEFRDKYIEFLKMGSRKFPIDELKTLGIDMTTSEVVEDTLNRFNELLKMFKELN